MKQILLVLIMFLISLNVTFGQKTVFGKVTDVAGEAIIGANILVEKNPTIGTSTDSDGSFKLIVPNTVTSIRISYTGYETQDVDVSDPAGPKLIILRESAVSISEMIVIGYGNSSKKMLTDNVVKLSSKSLSNIAVSNFQSTMSGKAAGVRINQTNGKVDGGINIRIRGASSLSAGSEPLYVLDGMPLINVNESNNGAPMNPLLSLSTSEIESIEILKDASSAAIYGARGANGVVLITTKKGKEGKTNVALNVSSGLSSPTHLVPFLNTAEYKELFTEAAINSLGETDGRAEAEGTFDFLANGTDWKNNAVDTDWGKLAFQDGNQSDIDLSVSGGDGKTQYFFGGAINKTKGIIRGNDLQRLSARMNVKHQISSKLNAGMNLGISKTTVERIDNDNSFTSPLQSTAQSPLSPAYNADGTPNANTLYPNFLLEDIYANYTTNIRRVTGKVFAEYNFLKNFKFNSDLGYDLSYQTEDQYRGRLTPFMSTNGFKYNSNATSENYIWSNYVTFNKSIKQNAFLNIVVGQEFNNSDRIFGSVTGTQFPSDDFQNISSAAEITAGKGETSRYNFLSYFARGTFNLKDKYFFKASVRRDGSSRFGSQQRYGIFPAFSMGWIISEESFIQNFQSLSFLKLRGSYGQLGNSEIGNFASRTLFSGVSYNKIPGINLTQPGNNNLKWEKTNQLDLGLEFGFFKDRISGEFDYYTKNTNALLFKVPLPGSSGQIEFNKNIGSLETKGVELVLNSKNIVAKEIRWNTSVNLANNVSKIKSLPNNNADIINGQNISRAGEAVSSFYLVEFAGADPKTGDALYYKNGIGSETTSNYAEAKRVIAGNPQPTWIAGLTNEFSYKGFSLSFTFVGEWGASIYLGGGLYQSSSADYFDNQTKDQLKRWKKEGDITKVPQARLYGQNGTLQSTRYLEKADFIRLRNVMLSYDIPSAITKKAKISSARLYISGVNLLTFTDYTGYDPESRTDISGANGFDGGFNFYSAPQAKTSSAGINVNF
ncbi:MAG: SusC/RagA family TonB-linked outer membrane protein [Saprospiraceae bacterium]